MASNCLKSIHYELLVIRKFFDLIKIKIMRRQFLPIKLTKTKNSNSTLYCQGWGKCIFSHTVNEHIN